MKFSVSFAYLTSGGWKTHTMEVEAPDSTRAEQQVREQMTGYSVLQIKSIDVVSEEPVKEEETKTDKVPVVKASL